MVDFLVIFDLAYHYHISTHFLITESAHSFEIAQIADILVNIAGYVPIRANFQENLGS